MQQGMWDSALTSLVRGRCAGGPLWHLNHSRSWHTWSVTWWSRWSQHPPVCPVSFRPAGFPLVAWMLSWCLSVQLWVRVTAGLPPLLTEECLSRDIRLLQPSRCLATSAPRPRQLLLGFSSSVATMCPFAFLTASRVRLALQLPALSFAGPRGAVSPHVQVRPELVMEAKAKGSPAFPAWTSTKLPVRARCPLEVLVQRKCFLPCWPMDQYLSWRVSGIWGWPNPEGQCVEMAPPC